MDTICRSWYCYSVGWTFPVGSVWFFLLKSRLEYTIALITERSPSGLWRRLGKAVYPQGYRGFESLSLRQTLKTLLKSSVFNVFLRGIRTGVLAGALPEPCFVSMPVASNKVVASKTNFVLRETRRIPLSPPSFE